MPRLCLIPTLLTLALFVPLLILLVETLAALYLPEPGRTTKEEPEGEEPRCAVLVPAHNEEKGIGRTLASLKQALSPRDQVLVVLDNCTDRTGEVVSAHGIRTVERRNHNKRGKGYALDFGVRALREDPPDMVVVLDADCWVDPDFLEEIKKALLERGRPIQALNLMKAPPGSGPLGKIAEFAWFFKSFVRQQGLSKLGLPCHLQGTGMAFLWKHLEGVDLAGSDLVEDMKLGIDLAAKGLPASFCVRAVVRSLFPRERGALKSQRTRWEHGQLALSIRKFPLLFLRSLLSGDFRLAVFTLDLAVPPLALLVLLLSFVTLLDLAAAFAGTLFPLFLACAAFLLLGGTIVLAWFKLGKSILSFRELLAVPWYIAGKTGLYLRFLGKREKEWVRTGRD